MRFWEIKPFKLNNVFHESKLVIIKDNINSLNPYSQFKLIFIWPKMFGSDSKFIPEKED